MRAPSPAAPLAASVAFVAFAAFAAPACLAAPGAPPRAPAQATVAWGKEPIKVSSTGPDNTLPSFLFMAGAEEGGSLFAGAFDYTGGTGEPQPFMPPVDCPDDIFNNTSPDLRVPQLPWALQDDWGCERKQSQVDVVVMENDFLRAAVTPQWGGKIWSLYDKKNKRQMVFNNPAHQPDNIGYRKAWTSGGAEWNWAPGKIGHSVFTESPVYLATIPSAKGPVVRVWEYDRLNHTVWQVDMVVEDDVLWVHPKITNPNDHELPGYWWTCVAMPATDRSRVISPADLSVTPCAAWPNGAWMQRNVSFRGADIDGCATADGGRGTCAWQQDMSFLGNIPEAHDFFMRIHKPQLPYIALAAEDGYTVIHSHPLNGTKFFQWGMDDHGAFQQDFMSASDYDNPACDKPYYDRWCEAYEHEGNYAELQIGPAPTQMHTFPVAGNSTFEWTEWFKALRLETSVAQSPNYDDALKGVADWLASDSGMPASKIADMDAFFEGIADVPPAQKDILARGMPWGGLREKMTGKTLAPGCPFDAPDAGAGSDDAWGLRPWLDLLETGTFSEATLKLTPINFEVDDTWVSMLKRSMSQGKETWLHNLFLGTHALEVGNLAGARAFFERSMQLQPSAHAARNLATIARNAAEGAGLYDQAWKLFQGLDQKVDPAAYRLGKDLSGEFAAYLMLNGNWSRLESLLADLPEEYAGKDRCLHAKAALHVEQGDFKSAKTILRGNCFPTYGHVRNDLIDLWWRANVQEAVAGKGGVPLTTLETLQLRRKLGCDGDSAVATLGSKCVRGPPNLGYAY